MESDPNGVSQHSPGAKLDAGKIEAGLLMDFGKALLAVAEISTFGANKYSRGGWLHVTDGYRRYTDAMIRHLLKESYEEYDLDSELLHAGHTCWNALARLELLLREKENERNSINTK